MGICTSCNKSTAIDEKHICNEDFILLGQTDWKITRHKEQIEAGVATSMTTEEYQALLAQRQAARERLSIVNVEVPTV